MPIAQITRRAPLCGLVVLVLACSCDGTPTTVDASPAKDLSSFAFTSADNPALAADVTATIAGTDVTAKVPFGTDVTALVATFTTTGVSVSVAGTAQTSGLTGNDFTSPVTYVVTAADGSTSDYVVTVAVAPDPAKDLTSFSFLAADNAGLPNDVTATITDTDITATVPYGTDVTALVATFTTTGATVSVAGAPQTSGTTADDFTSPVTYRVTAADGSTKDYVVTIAIALDPEKDLTSFWFRTADNPGLTGDVTATITDTDITATMPYGTDVTALVATFTTTGAAVAVAGTPQTSGTTSNDFTSPLTYRVTAADGSTKDYVVTITVALNPAKDLTSFSFLAADNPGLPSDVTAQIDGSAIAAVVPFGTDVTALVATFTTTGASVAVGGAIQASGVTANDFTNVVVYTVTAEDGTTQDYTVRVARAPSFYATVSFPTSSQASSVAIADFNADGKPDLAVTNETTNTVSILMSTTAAGATVPSFAAKVDFATGTDPYSVAVGDFNGDGKPDLAIADRRSDTISVLLDTTAANAAKPTFAARVAFATGVVPQGVAVADFNADGKPDVAVANYTSATASVLLDTTAKGAAKPTFSADVEFATQFGPQSVCVADFDMDGKPDVAVASPGGLVSILLDTTAAGATTPTFAGEADVGGGHYPRSIAAGDLNADGRPDLAAANYTADNASVLFNQWAGFVAFTPYVTFPTGGLPTSVAIGDLNGDGAPDLAVASSGNISVSVLVNTTVAGAMVPSFSSKFDFGADQVPAAVAIGDLNQDGKPDLAVANGASTVSVLLSR